MIPDANPPRHGPAPQLPAARRSISAEILDCMKRVWEAVKNFFCCFRRVPVPAVPNPDRPRDPDALLIFMNREEAIYEPAFRDLRNAVEQYTLGRPLEEPELVDLTRRKQAAEALFAQENQEYANVQQRCQSWPRSTHGMQYRWSGIPVQISQLLAGQPLERSLMV